MRIKEQMYCIQTIDILDIQKSKNQTTDILDT